VFKADASRIGDTATLGELESLAKEVTRTQLSLIGTRPILLALAEGEDTTVALAGPDNEHGRAAGATPHTVRVTLLHLESALVRVAAAIDSLPADTFDVSYFDAPYTDNTLLPDHHRIALMLKRVELQRPARAFLNLIEFPAHFVTTGYRPSIEEADEMVKETAKGGRATVHPHARSP
jgi:hypothetical protein